MGITGKRWHRGIATVAVLATAGTGAAVLGSGHNAPDTQKPFVGISAPATDGTTVSGTTTVTARCEDNSGSCASVQFKINGGNFGAPDTSSPFSISWDTTQYGNGTYQLSANGTDAAGNQGISTNRSAIISGAAPPTFTANVFTVGDASTSGASTTCVRFSTPQTYAFAIANNGVCKAGSGNAGVTNGTAFDNACWAATGGDLVGMKDGTYTRNFNNGAMAESNHDCSDGLGADVNPNCVEQNNFASCGTKANWVTYKCADTDCATVNPATDQFNLNWSVGGFKFFRGNYHTQFVGVPFNTGVFTNYGGESSGQQVQNLQFLGNSTSDPAVMFGLQIIGSKNVMLQNIDYGPGSQCGLPGPNTPDPMECVSNPLWWFEDQFLNWATSSVGCTAVNSSVCGGFFGNQPAGTGSSDWDEMYIHDGGAGAYTNVRLQDVIDHDMNARQAGTGVHPGCLFNFDSGNSSGTTLGNLVIDHLVCIRTTGATLQLSDSGVIVQNSVFTPLVATLNQTTPALKWDELAPGGNSAGFAAKMSNGSVCPDTTVMTNDLIRYNTFVSGGSQTPIGISDKTTTGQPFCRHSNVRFIGNLIMGSVGGANCGVAGVTFDRNVYTNGSSACGTNTTVLSAGDPLTQSSVATSDHLWTTGTNLGGFDPHLDGSPAVPTMDVTALGTDFQLNHDATGTGRTSTAMRYGAYN